MSETQTENSKAMENALKKVEQAKANLARVKREEKQKLSTKCSSGILRIVKARH